MGCGSEEPESRQAADTPRRQAAQSAGVAPGFVLPDLEGNKVDFRDYDGKVVLVDFWATWCYPCRKSVPHLKQLHEKHSGKGFAVVGVSLDHGGVGKVKQFAREMGIPYKVVMGNRQVQMAWQTGNGIPVAYVVDREGRIVRRMVGYRDYEVYEQEILKHL
jgi:thiol-disulfide isomerase/thioredoxin